MTPSGRSTRQGLVESYRDWLTNGGRRDAFLLPEPAENHGTLPGGYNWARVGCYPPKPPPVKRRSQEKRHYPFEDTPWFVCVCDNDDGCYKRHFATETEAQAALEELTQLVPFCLHELGEFGYNSE